MAAGDWRDAALSEEEFARAAGVRVATLVRLVQLGIVERGPSGFEVVSVRRVRRLLRLRSELAVNLAGAAVILELLERLERLEAQLGRTPDR